MMKIVVLLLALMAGVVMGSIEKRITGPNARDCKPDEGLHQVMLSLDSLTKDQKDKDYRSVYCGGTWITQEWILTAAHCSHPYLIVLEGRNRLNADIRAIIQKEKYPDTDIMLVKVAPPTGQTRQIAGLPDPQNCPTPEINTDVDIFGWKDAHIDPHNLKMYPTDAYFLRCAKMKVVSNNGATFCAKGDKVDSNKGDSGSGLLWKGKLHGVQVEGDVTFCTGPTTLKNVCHKEYREWIHKFTGV